MPIYLEESNYGRSFEEVKANPNRITITTSVETNLVKIAIMDNGKGMSEQVKSKVFDHFIYLLRKLLIKVQVWG
ncbi:MAG: ATP-binding protein [Nostoc sp.]